MVVVSANPQPLGKARLSWPGPQDWASWEMRPPETTGLADPAPVAQTFFVDQDVADRTKLDAIVTVADAVHLSSQIGEHHEAEEQIAFADVVLLNKIDLVKDKEIDIVKDRIRKINPYAKIIKTSPKT